MQVHLGLSLLSLLVVCPVLTVKCRNGVVYRISTDGGICRHSDVTNPDAPGGSEIVGGICSAGRENRAYVTCGGGCRYVIGSGSCEVVSEAAP